MKKPWEVVKVQKKLNSLAKRDKDLEIVDGYVILDLNKLPDEENEEE